MPLILVLRRQGRQISEFKTKPGLQSEFQDSQGYKEKPCFKTKKTKQTHIHTHTHTSVLHTHTHTHTLQCYQRNRLETAL